MASASQPPRRPLPSSSLPEQGRIHPVIFFRARTRSFMNRVIASTLGRGLRHFDRHFRPAALRIGKSMLQRPPPRMIRIEWTCV